MVERESLRRRRRSPVVAMCAGAALALTQFEASAGETPGFRVRIGRKADAAAVQSAIEGAARRLTQPECREILSEFRDASDRSLQEKLDALGATVEDYLGWVLFYDGFGERACSRRSVLAVTEPGSRVVRICSPQFAEMQRRQASRVEVTILHESLHTLGLEEDPPTTEEITSRVIDRCYPELVAVFGRR